MDWLRAPVPAKLIWKQPRVVQTETTQSFLGTFSQRFKKSGEIASERETAVSHSDLSAGMEPTFIRVPLRFDGAAQPLAEGDLL